MKLCAKYEVKGHLFCLDSQSKKLHTIETTIAQKVLRDNVSTTEITRTAVNLYYITMPWQTRLGGTTE